MSPKAWWWTFVAIAVVYGVAIILWRLAVVIF